MQTNIRIEENSEKWAEPSIPMGQYRMHLNIYSWIFKKRKKKMGQGKYSKRLNPRAGGEGGAAYLGTL